MNLLFHDSVHPGKQTETLTNSQSDDSEQPGTKYSPVAVLRTPGVLGLYVAESGGEQVADKKKQIIMIWQAQMQQRNFVGASAL